MKPKRPDSFDAKIPVRSTNQRIGHRAGSATVETLTMGLDLVLGVIVVVTAIRGWLKGFTLQAIRLAGLVACVYLADPVRDLAKPYVLPQLPSIRPELLVRLLWWTAAALAYVVLVGLAMLILKFSRRQAFGIAEPRRNDQYAGFALGAAKGVVIALFLVAGLQKYAFDRVKSIAWAQEQVSSSFAVRWNEQYQPATKIWSSPPVQHFVDHVQRMGLSTPGSSTASPGTDPKPLQAASGHPPRLQIPSSSEWTPGLNTTGLDPELSRAVEAIEQALQKAAPARPN
jgi:uncharacterized membrane protein required for colicin V production